MTTAIEFLKNEIKTAQTRIVQLDFEKICPVTAKIILQQEFLYVTGNFFL